MKTFVPDITGNYNYGWIFIWLWERFRMNNFLQDGCFIYLIKISYLFIKNG